MIESREWSVTLHKHAHRQRDIQLLAELLHPFLLELAPTIRQEDKGYPGLLQVGQRLTSSGQRILASEKYAIYAGYSI